MKNTGINMQALDGTVLMHVSGKLFEIEGIKFVVHKLVCEAPPRDNATPRLHSTLLQVTEYTTGCCFVKSYEKQKYAIDAAKKRFEHLGIDGVMRAIANFPKLNA